MVISISRVLIAAPGNEGVTAHGGIRVVLDQQQEYEASDATLPAFEANFLAKVLWLFQSEPNQRAPDRLNWRHHPKPEVHRAR